ncbi:MAG: ion transporter [Rubrobacter sp.]|jgi:voltage-gated potassium channel|nr:ion transporter [Rubrobacter sp.]MDQ3638840.1 ion transporter [Actinomycetota bacterium]
MRRGGADTGSLREDPGRREDLRERLDHYLDVPLALASVLMVLLAVVELGGEVGEPWRGRLATLGWSLWGLFFVEFAVKFALAPVKRAYLRRNWLDVLVLLVPFLRFLKVLGVLKTARALPLFRLLVFGGRGSGAAVVLLRRRRLGQLALISVLVILIGATTGFVLEADARASTITDFGDALWWSAALVTTVGSELYPVTAGGRILGFVLMLYAVGVFSYFIASIASVLVGLDARQGDLEATGQKGVRLDEQEVEVLRRILKRADEARR